MKVFEKTTILEHKNETYSSSINATKSMTDKEIIQAFEHYNWYDDKDITVTCVKSVLLKNAYFLMCKQQAEIDKLQKTIENRNEADRIALEAYEQLLYENDYQHAKIDRLKAEHEKTTAYCASLFDKYEKTKIAKDSLENTIYTARAETILVR